jgi:hypothetical protein
MFLINTTYWCLSIDWTTGVRPAAEANDYSSGLRVQTSSEVHPDFYPTGTGGPSSGVKRGRGVTLTTHPHPEQRSKIHGRLHGVS